MQLQEKPRDTIANSGESVSAASDGKLHTHGLYRLGFNYGRFIHRFRVLVIILWAVGLAISVPFALQLTSKLTGGGYSMSSSESVQVGNVMVDRLHAPPSTLLVAFHSASVAVTDPSYQAQINAIAQQFRDYPHVTGVTAAGPGQDGHTTYLAVNFDKTSDYVEPQVPDIMKMLPSGSDAGPARVWLTGGPAIYREFTEITDSETRGAERRRCPSRWSCC